MSTTNDQSTIFGIFHRVAIPEGATPVSSFDLEKYLGKWYEIARLDFYWENENLTNVFAEYSANKNGTVKVVNTGYNEKKEKWETFTGEAKFRGDNTLAALDVSFFGPIWAGYNVVSVDDNYKHALVFGRDTNYLWFLSRDKHLPEIIKMKYLLLAQKFGYDVEKLNWTKQDRDPK